jgi:hypothetical protein
VRADELIGKLLRLESAFVGPDDADAAAVAPTTRSLAVPSGRTPEFSEAPTMRI